MTDIRDILEIESAKSDITKESIIGADKKARRALSTAQKANKRPEGMAREVFALLYNDKKDAPPLFPTDTGQGYKNTKAKLGMKSVRPWRWTPFTNPARKDNAVFHHWRRVCDEGKEYPFAKFNKEVQIPTYTDAEYSAHLANDSWTRDETDHLFDLCKRFDLRFVVMCDRWDKTKFKPRSIEDLKERYYHCLSALAQVKTGPGLTPEAKSYVFDAEHERKRKEQLLRLYNRSKDQVEEEQMLQNELRKIEARKKERDRKTQDLQKLITAADSQNEPRKAERKFHKKKLQLRFDTLSGELANIKFPDIKGSGVTVRSQRMKLPANIGQKKMKAIERLLAELNIEMNPIPTEEICQNFNELRSDLLLLNELKSAMATCQFELQTLRHQYEAINPGKTLIIPKSLCAENETVEASENTKIKTEIIDVVGSPQTVNT
ncbi:DNA methyltransferase 1-associated protein 1 [Cimex lectularius]|uniref:DNA methyltransferase 1-associated protein 1 n=1 Tax=Cimex lectularius TaxID=79782 RepID=A0A8I6RE28_CIMLE|nr:DNA methyltransferase 1-associated protein 1 [Cimex lectularius]